ncbi:MAG: Rieske (2Fe-2S) protein [Gammaproteobacteria bacterium]|nr:Rieske (2Fe-2S) protein [Gammaproteobacteria bacterium]
MRFYPLEKLINLHDNYTRQFKIDHLHLLLLQRGTDRYLVEASCPHREHPLNAGSIAHGVIECALHGYRFSLEDGRVLYRTEEPCRALRTFPIVYEGNELGTLLDV